jgi:hypothetical protein
VFSCRVVISCFHRDTIRRRVKIDSAPGPRFSVLFRTALENYFRGGAANGCEETRAAGADNCPIFGPGWFDGIDSASTAFGPGEAFSDARKLLTLSIQDAEKCLGSLYIVFMEIQPVTGNFRKDGPSRRSGSFGGND